MRHFFVIALLLSGTLGYAQKQKVKDNGILKEKVPAYHSCDRNMSNQALKECMSSQINTLVTTHFNQDIAKQLGFEHKSKYRIHVIFKVDTLGHVIDIRARAPHSKLEQEAIRVIKLIPQFEYPGTINNKPVTVPYSIPLLLVVDNPRRSSNNEELELNSFPVHKGCNENLSFENQKKCSSKKVTDFVKLSFNMELADKLFPLEKSTQFQVDFIINKKGRVEQVTAKAHKREIAVEAINILKRLPKFKNPGYKNGKAVDTPFSILMTLYF